MKICWKFNDLSNIRKMDGKENQSENTHFAKFDYFDEKTNYIRVTCNV